MVLAKDPVLAVWEAMNLLEEVRACSDTPEISKSHAVAETALFGLVVALVRRIESMIPAGNVITRFESAVPP